MKKSKKDLSKTNLVEASELPVENQEVESTEIQTKKEIRWDLLAVIASERKEDQEQVQVALQAGYEPFCVVPHVLPQESSAILNPNQPPQPKFANLVWMKRGVLVDVRD
jgi:hypothetical protein